MSNPLEVFPSQYGRLTVIAPNVVEFAYMETKPATPGTLSRYNYITGGVYNQPTLSNFTLTKNGATPVSFSAIRYKRRPYWVAYKRYNVTRDLRCMTWLYFMLDADLTVGDALELSDNVNVEDWITTYAADQNSPVIHVNQVGYVPSWSKKAYLGYYLGTGGELDCNITDFPEFEVITMAGDVVHTGNWVNRADHGYTYSPTPYQKVLEADLSAFTTPGKYMLQVAGLGRSLPFHINEGVAMQLARTCALGIFNQRCGYEVGLPYSRHEHNLCHSAVAEIPTPQASYESAWDTITDNNVSGALQDPGVPAITSVATCLYPYVKSGTIDTSGAHHDAGDYSKYTPSVSMFIHCLTFAADSMGAAGELDNLGIPESGDGKSDLLAEAKWAADYLLKIQDDDGGFFWLCNPKVGRYELEESLTGSSVGVTQVLWPKTTASTAAAVGALAELGSSPRFRSEYGTVVADSYIAAAVDGWDFLMNAIATHGLTGSFQALFQTVWAHDDVFAYAAASLFAATGDTAYQTKLMTWWPDANKNGIRGSTSPISTYRWSWWRLTFFWGAAARVYAFAVRSGRRTLGEVNGAYMAACESEIHAAAQYELDSAESAWSRNAYGTSFQYDAKSFASGVAGYYYPLEFCLNLAVSHILSPSSTKFNVILQNVNYMLGANPLNMTFLSGIGQRRQRNLVQVTSFNDPWRKLPVNGHLVGAISSGVPLINDGYFGFVYLNGDGTNEMSSLIFPQDGGSPQYPFYDRFTDVWNINEEWVTGFSGAKTFAVAAWLASLTTYKDQEWSPA